ncbi:MAG: DUF4145 domain-containing protein [Planctomycetota bacterium]
MGDKNERVRYSDFGDLAGSEGPHMVACAYIVCPNEECKQAALQVSLTDRKWDGREFSPTKLLRTWRLLPESSAKAFPNYIPKAIMDDYNEACLIVDKSPKASATLSRRCLQGMIRDFWEVKPARLVEEIKAIEDKTDPQTWKAIDAVRRIGNIGAHMETDINVIVEVEADEAEALILLIEVLLKDWYVTREERAKRLAQVKAIGDNKVAAKNGSPAPSPSPKAQA